MRILSKSVITAVCCHAAVYCFMLSLPSALAQQLQTTVPGELPPVMVEKMDQLLIRYGDGTPGASVLVSRAGQVVYERYVGMADLEHGVPVTAGTVFEAGSVSKQFTAAGILLLVSEGKVDLDAEIQRYLPEIPVYQRPVTVRHLFNHTSGLKDWGSLAGLGGWPRGTRAYTNDMALKYIIRQPDLNYLPGDEYLYSNSNYTLMTILLERVSGQSLADFTAERFFRPLGMDQTSWRTDYRDVVPGRAIGYGRSGNTYRMNMPFEHTYGHAALLTTVRDLRIWNEAWYRLSAATDGREAQVRQMLGGLRGLREQQGVLTSGDTIAYAAGVQIFSQHGRRVVSHSGATAGYRAWLAYYPEEELSIVFLSNDANAPTTATGEGLAEILLGLPGRPADSASGSLAATADEPVAPILTDQLLQSLPGEYYSPAVEGRWTIVNDQGRLAVQVHPHSRLHGMEPAGEDRFSAPGLGRIQIVRSATGDEGGGIRGFYVTIDRARNVWFDKID